MIKEETMIKKIPLLLLCIFFIQCQFINKTKKAEDTTFGLNSGLLEKKGFLEKVLPQIKEEDIIFLTSRISGDDLLTISVLPDSNADYITASLCYYTQESEQICTKVTPEKNYSEKMYFNIKHSARYTAYVQQCVGSERISPINNLPTCSNPTKKIIESSQN
jgi:hypothetical protein